MNENDAAEPDDIDKAWLDSIVPEGCVPLGFIGIASWLDEDGTQRWRCYSQIDVPISASLGLLELAKLELIARTDTGLPIRYPNLDD